MHSVCRGELTRLGAGRCRPFCKRRPREARYGTIGHEHFALTLTTHTVVHAPSASVCSHVGAYGTLLSMHFTCVIYSI